jgi:hypothetical protein
MTPEERCDTCGDPATQYDYDQFKVLCDRHIEQSDFTVPLDDFIRRHRGEYEKTARAKGIP